MPISKSRLYHAVWTLDYLTTVPVRSQVEEEERAEASAVIDAARLQGLRIPSMDVVTDWMCGR
ncbi:hypothetical protein ACUN0C_19120 [Faunimonas sp. B44]|uniref:hypothetical protein n=1 Tax=Faunimonas sp. B44 TaxID=3461493 RepID=UPI004043EA6D